MQQQLERMSKSFSGVEIKKQADLAIASLKSVGTGATESQRLISGAAKLTEAEQRKVNATVTEAIAKYRALGQQAPADMIALAKATEQVAKPTQAAALSVKDLAAGYVAGMVTFEAAKRVLGGIVDFLKSSVQSYAAAEKATAKLTQALRNTGDASAETISDMSDLASEFQRTTRFSDDLVTEVQALFTQLGEVGPKDMKVAIQAAADLSEGLGIDLEQAATAVSKALQGNETSLKKLAPSLDEAAISGGNLADIAGEIEKRFGGQAAAQLDTYAGRVAQLANEWDNVKEAIGRAIATDPIVTASLRGLAESLGGVGEEAQGLTVSEIALTGAMSAQMPIVSRTIELFRLWSIQANAVAENQAFILRTTDALSKKPTAVSLKGMFPEITAAGLALWDKQNDLIDAARVAAKKYAAEVAAAAKKLAADVKAQLLDVEKFHREAAIANTKIYKDEADKSMKVLANTFMERMRLEKEADREIRRLSMSATEFKIDEIQRWAEAEKYALSLTEGDWTEHYTQIERVAGVKMLAIIQDTEEYKLAMIQLGTVFPPLLSYLDTLEGKTGQAAKAAEDWGDTLFAASDALRLIADSTADRTIARIASAFANMAGTLGNVIGLIKDYNKALKEGSTSGQASAAIGLASLFVGAVLRLSRALDDAELQKKIRQVQKEWLDMGFAISAEQARINATTRSFVREFTESIESAGGVTAYNLGNVAKAFNDILRAAVAVERARRAATAAGKDMAVPRDGTGVSTSIKDIAAEIEEIFPQMAKVIVDSGSLANKEILEIIRNVRQLGIESAAVTAFVSAQANKALGGFGKFLNARGGIVDQLTEAQKKLDDLLKRSGDDSADIDPEDIAAATAEVAKFQKQLDAIPLTAAGAGAVGASLFAIFEELVRGGQPAIDVLKQIDPLIGSLDRQLAAAGLSGGAAFDSLKDLAGLATDEVFGPAFEAISGLGLALEGLNNAGLLNQDTFAGLADQVTATFNGLVAQGVDGEKAMRLIQPTLQDLWELQEDFGYSVDEATQKLLDEAKAAGFVGDEHRTAAEQMLIATKRIADAVEGLARIFGVELPSDIAKTRKALENLPNPVITPTIDWPSMTPPGGWPQPPAGYGGGSYGGNRQRPDPDPGMASGGLVPTYFAGGGPSGSDTVPAWLTPGEFVMRRDAVDRVGVGTLSAMNRGLATEPTVVNNYHFEIRAVDAKSFADLLRDPQNKVAVADATIDAVSRNSGGTLSRFAAATRR